MKKCKPISLFLAILLISCLILPVSAEKEEQYDYIESLAPIVRLNGDGLASYDDGEDVTKWLDSSGMSANAIKVPEVKLGASTGKPFSFPKLKENALNGYPTVAFDRGESSALVIPGGSFGGKKQYTIAAVYKTEMTSSAEDPMSSALLDQFVLRQRLGTMVGLGVMKSFPGYSVEKGCAYGACASKNATGGWGCLSSGKYVDTEFHIQVIVYDAELGTMTTYVDGATVATVTWEPVPVSVTHAADYVWLGNDWRGNVGLHGELAELVVLETALDEVKADLLGSYLADYYGLEYSSLSGKVLPISLVCVQETIAKNGKFDVRLVSAVDSLLYHSVGFRVSVDGGEKETVSSSTVYSSICAGDDQFQAQDCGATYLCAIPLRDLPASGNVTITVAPIYVQSDGSVIYGFTYRLLYTDGAFVSYALSGGAA